MYGRADNLSVPRLYFVNHSVQKRSSVTWLDFQPFNIQQILDLFPVKTASFSCYLSVYMTFERYSMCYHVDFMEEFFWGLISICKEKKQTHISKSKQESNFKT